jgi:hypothetical protein
MYKTTEDRIMMHRSAKKAAVRSPGAKYNLPDQFSKKVGAKKGFGFGHGARFKDPHKERRDKEGSPGPAGYTVKSTLGKNARQHTMQSRKSLNKLNAYTAKTDSPGPGTKNINLGGTMGKDSPSFSMKTRDAYLVTQDRKLSPTSAISKMVRERKDSQKKFNLIRANSGLGGRFGEVTATLPHSPIATMSSRRGSNGSGRQQW